MDLAICCVICILVGIMININNLARELSEIIKILEEKEK